MVKINNSNNTKTHPNKQMTTASVNIRKWEHFFTVGGLEKWNRHYINWLGGS